MAVGHRGQYDSYVQAQAALHSAETAVQQAQVTYDNARQAEPTNIQHAEAKLADAQAQLTALQHPSTNAIAQQQASVDQAKASLTQAQANVAKLTAPGTDTDVAIQDASVTQAAQSLKQAQLSLEQATLKAPFAGVVRAVNIVLPRQNAVRQVEMPLIYRGVCARERHRRAEVALQIVGMAQRMHHRPTELSGGQQQRVAIVRALVGSPAVLLADEPTGALDTKASEEIMRILQRLNTEQGLTVVLVTHESDIAEYAQRVLTMRDGVLVGDGPPRAHAA